MFEDRPRASAAGPRFVSVVDVHLFGPRWQGSKDHLREKAVGMIVREHMWCPPFGEHPNYTTVIASLVSLV